MLNFTQCIQKFWKQVSFKRPQVFSIRCGNGLHQFSQLNKRKELYQLACSTHQNRYNYTMRSRVITWSAKSMSQNGNQEPAFLVSTNELLFPLFGNVHFVRAELKGARALLCLVLPWFVEVNLFSLLQTMKRLTLNL